MQSSKPLSYFANAKKKIENRPLKKKIATWANDRTRVINAMADLDQQIVVATFHFSLLQKGQKHLIQIRSATEELIEIAKKDL
jgi:hypothetical protein